MNGKRRISRFGMNNFWNAHKNLTPRVSFRAKNDTQLLTFQPWHYGRAVKRIALKFFRPRIPRSFNCHESKCARLIKELSFPCELWFFFLRWTCQSAALLRCSVETVVMSTRVASLSPNRFGFATLSFFLFSTMLTREKRDSREGATSNYRWISWLECVTCVKIFL